MALKYPDRLESNNPKAFGIAKAVEISGHKTVKNLDSLYSIADCILSDSKSNLDNDAIGQEWYVIDQDSYYKLVSWENRKNGNGWTKRQEINENIVTKDKIGVANGLAQLDDTGKVPSSQLPSYVDDILEYQEKDSFPKPGQKNKIYVELKTNLTYRWSGTDYVEISPSIALGETSSTAYAGDKGKALATQVSALENTVRNIPDITLINVDQMAESAADGTAVTIAFKKYDRTSSAESSVSTKIPAATSSSAGVMSKADKTKLDDIVIATDAEIDTIFTESIA